MNETDEISAERLNAALARAKAAGQTDVAEYLLLKTANDALRSACVDWLIESALAIARQANAGNARIAIENENPHRFAVGGSHPVGALLRFTQGVRCLTIEAGWTRSPADGFMRGGALALARLTHFGLSRENEDLSLIKNGTAPDWFAVRADGARQPFDARDLQRHFQIFLGVDSA